jgi:DNA-binding CsgD family transcriptional regulator
LPEAIEDDHRALAMAQELGYPGGEALALIGLSFAASYASDFGSGLAWAQQAQRIDPAEIPGWVARRGIAAAGLALLESGEAASARRCCVDGLARAQDAGDVQDQARFVYGLAVLDLQTGHIREAAAHLRESIRIATQAGDQLRLIDCLDEYGLLCAATQRWAEAVTLWAACPAGSRDRGTPDQPQQAQRRQEAAQALGPARTQEAEQRGAAMTLQTAAEFAIMLTEQESDESQENQEAQESQESPGLAHLSGRERELVTLVARGLTNAQIASELYISVRTVGSHLDRIRDKTGCRRRADLTRLALQAGLV